MSSEEDSTTTEPPVRRVLVVDDDKGIRRVLSTFLSRQGFEVIAAEDGDQALAMLHETVVHLVISDMVMPRVGGIELLEEVKADKPWVPVIMITGMPEVDVAVECMKQGAFDYITKPFDFDKIKETVQRALEQSREMRQQDHLQNAQSRFFGHYQIEEILGEGNVGVVFLAVKEDDPDHRQVALKILKQGFVTSSERKVVLQRFMTEAKIASQVKHPNIIEVLEYDTLEDEGLPYIVMEYFESKPLTHYIDFPDQLDYRQKTRLLCQVSDALAALHQQQIYHRDIKPHNILVNRELDVRLMDFGIAKNPDAHLTLENELIGSPAYLSPEGFGGKQRFDHRSDIFSLGIVAYELLTGQRPFQGESIPHYAHLIQHERPLAPRKLDADFPRPLEHILARLLKKDPKDRYQQATDVAKDFRTFLAGKADGRSTIFDTISKRLNADWK